MTSENSRRKFIKQVSIGTAASLLVGRKGLCDVVGKEVDPQQFTSAEIELGAVGKPPDIVFDSSSAIVAVAGTRLASYLRELTQQAAVSSKAPSAAERVIVLGDSSLASAYGVAPPEDGLDSFKTALVKKGGQQLLIVSGRTPQGIKQGVYHVMRNLSVKKSRLLLTNPTFQFNPFFAVRGVHLGGYVRQATPEQLAWNHVENWEPERASDYIDMLDFFGYNLIESEPGHLKIRKGLSSTDQKQSAHRRDVFASRIRHNGMRHMLHFIGTLHGPNDRFAHISKNPGIIPYGADTKDLYANYYLDEAKALAPYLDSVMTHWADTGGWKSTPEYPCTIEVLQELHMQIHRAFKEVTPSIESILGLWGLYRESDHKWLGFENVDTILKGGRIPKQVGLAMPRTVKVEDARNISSAGHKSSAWGWYLTDHELVYTMHVHTHPLKEYLQKLPQEVRDLVQMQTVESCQAETNLYSLYVGARMLCNPSQDPEVYLREVARLVYGPHLELPVFLGLKAIADVRCGKRCRGYWTPIREGTTPSQRTQSNGVVDFDQARDQAGAAWKGLENVQIDKTYVPPTRFHRPVETLLKELKGHVEAIAKYMQSLQDRKDGKRQLTEVPRAQGPFEYYERMQYLKPGELYWPSTGNE